MGVNLSERMQYLREHKSATMDQIAEVAGVTQAAVSQWSNGKTSNIKAQVALKLAKHYNVNYHWLSDGEGDPEDFNEEPNYAKIISYYRKFTIHEQWDDKTDALYVDKNFLEKHDICIPKCIFIKAWDNSMEPLIFKGDYLIVELSQDIPARDVNEGKVYFFQIDGKPHIRRLYPKLNGDLILSSENPKFGEDRILEQYIGYVGIIGQIKARLGAIPFN